MSVKKRLSVMKPMIKLELTDEQQQALWQLKRHGRNHEERCRASIIVEGAKGRTRAEIAVGNDCSVSTVDKALSRFRSGGVAALRSGRFRPHRRKVGQAGLDLVAAAIRQSPRAACPGAPPFDRSLWTLPLLADFLAAQIGVRVDDDTVRRYLQLLGWTTRSPKLSCTSPDPEYGSKMAAIQDLRQQAEKGGPRRRWSSTTTRPS